MVIGIRGGNDYSMRKVKFVIYIFYNIGIVPLEAMRERKKKDVIKKRYLAYLLLSIEFSRYVFSDEVSRESRSMANGDSGCMANVGGHVFHTPRYIRIRVNFSICGRATNNSALSDIDPQITRLRNYVQMRYSRL